MSRAVSEISISPIIVTRVVFLDSLNINSVARLFNLRRFRRRFEFLAALGDSVGCQERGGGGKYEGWRLGWGYGDGLANCLGKKCCGGSMGPIRRGSPLGL